MRVIAAAAICAALLACSGDSGTPTPTPGPTSAATATPSLAPTPVITPAPTTPPTSAPTPVPATPAPTDAPSWSELATILGVLGLEASPDLPVQTDPTTDATTADGSAPAEISADLDIIGWFAGWARPDAGLWDDDGPLSCDRDEVHCTDDPLPPSDPTAVVAAFRTAELIDLSADRGGIVAVALARPGFANSPSDAGGYSDGDLVFYVDITSRTLVALEWKPGGFVVAPRRGGEARVIIHGDTTLFILPNDRAEKPKIRFVTYERIPVDDLDAGVTDVAVDVESFSTIDFQLQPLP